VADLSLDEAVVVDVLGVLARCGQQEDPDRWLPSVAMCGSDAVVDAYAHAAVLIRAQEANTWAGWGALARQTAATLTALGQIDAQLAAAVR
jgi:hypothetical protein